MKHYIHNFFAILFFCSLFITSTNNGFSQNSSQKSIASKLWKVIPFERKAFIENKGQFDKLIPEDKKGFTYCIDKGQQVFFYKNSLSYRFNRTTFSKAPLWGFFETEEQKEERIRNTKKSTEYIDIEWFGSNQNATIVAENKQSTYYSYVTNVSNQNPQTVFCDGYSKIIYKNLYPNIDVEYVFHPEEGIKYNLLLHPGANIGQVKMKYNSNVKLSIKNGNIHIKTIVGEIVDHAPVTFYAENKQNIPSAFKIENNVVSFDIANVTTNKEIVIDPWSVIPGFTPSQAYDNGTDNVGNIYIYGGTQNAYVVEKYSPTGGAPIWSLSNSGIDQNYYGDLLVESSGNFYLSEGYRAGGAYTYKYDPSSALIWQSNSSGDYQEHWRMAINCLTQKVIVAGGGTSNPTKNIAEIQVSTGLLTNAISSYNLHDDMAGVCVDDSGKCYMIGGISNLVFFTDATNNTIGAVASGYNLSEIGVGGTPSYHQSLSANGYSMMALGGASFLFTSDGTTVKKWDRNTQTVISSIIIPGGQQNMGGGVLADKCNNLFVGTSNGVYRFDFNLVQKEYQATTAAVYDIAYASNGYIVASGNGFLQTLPFGREACGIMTLNEIAINPCNPEINTVKVVPATGLPPFTFLWDDGNTDSVRTNLSQGNHIVFIKDGSCSPSFIIDTITISGNLNFISIDKIPPLCSNQNDGQINITLLNNQDITSIVWTPNVTNSLINDSTSQAINLPSGTYNCLITSSLGCNFDTTITLASQFASPFASFIDAQACQNQSVLFNENSSSSDGTINSWVWNFGDNTPTSNLQNPSHIYTTEGSFNTTLIIGTSNGCFDTIVKQTVIHSIPDANFSTNNVCEGNATEFNDQSTITTPSIIQNWQWDWGDGSLIDTNQNAFHSFSGIGNYNVNLKVTTNFGCTDSSTITITVNPSFTIHTAITPLNMCTSGTILLGGEPTVEGNTGPYTYNWSPNIGLNNNTIANPIAIINSTTTYTLSITDVNGCIITDSVNILFNSGAVHAEAGFENNSLCTSGSLFLGGNPTASNGIGPYNYKWIPSTGLNDSLNANPIASINDTITYVVLVNDNLGCQDIDSVFVIFNPNGPIVEAGFGNTTMCTSGTIMIGGNPTATGGILPYSYSWLPATGINSPLSANPLATISSNNLYMVLVTDSTGCQSLDSIALSFNASGPFADAGGDTTICFGQNVLLGGTPSTTGGSPPYLYEWTPTNLLTADSIPNPIALSVTSNTTFYLSVSDNLGCSSVDTALISVVGTGLVADFTANPTVGDEQLNIQFTNQSTGTNISSFWSFGDGFTSTDFNPNHTYFNTTDSTINYTVMLVSIDSFGCSDTSTLISFINLNPSSSVFFPNVFTPNDDGVNDLLMFNFIDFESGSVSIFNRWGELLFKTEKPNTPWDGRTASGIKVNDGVYFYIFKGIVIGGKVYEKNGYIQLIR